MARGKLRLYLGAAPGVGKTYAMLNEGWRRKERGTDVVIGWVQEHGRPQTDAQIRDLEIFPRQRGRVPGTDLRGDGPRRPPRSGIPTWCWWTSWPTPTCPARSIAKRWQDVEELLDAGINVISTVNLQHLESLNDVVERITGVAQQETVPDPVVRDADQLELVDMAPEALRRRMAHGNVYPPSASTPPSGTTSAPATSPRCASWRSCGWPTGSTRSSTTTASATTSPGRGRPRSAWWCRSPGRGAVRC